MSSHRRKYEVTNNWPPKRLTTSHLDLMANNDQIPPATELNMVTRAATKISFKMAQTSFRGEKAYGN